MGILKKQYNVFNCFKILKALVEKKSGYFIKLLRIDSERILFEWVLWRSKYKKLLAMPRSHNKIVWLRTLIKESLTWWETYSKLREH